MAVDMVTQVAGERFQVTISRDGAGNYVAEAVRLLGSEHGHATEAPCVRVVHPTKERAVGSVLDLLQNLGRARTGAPLRGA